MVKIIAGNLITLVSNLEHQPLIVIFNFQTAFTTKMHIVHVYMQCSLRVDGINLHGVLLTSFFCVVPESSYCSMQCSIQQPICSLVLKLLQLVAPSQWQLHSKTSTLKEAVTETGGCSAPVPFMWTITGFTEKPSVDFIPTELTYMQY